MTYFAPIARIIALVINQYRAYKRKQTKNDHFQVFFYLLLILDKIFEVKCLLSTASILCIPYSKVETETFRRCLLFITRDGDKILP